jgi:hypothetical protein
MRVGEVISESGQNGTGGCSGTVALKARSFEEWGYVGLKRTVLP